MLELAPPRNADRARGLGEGDTPVAAVGVVWHVHRWCRHVWCFTSKVTAEVRHQCLHLSRCELDKTCSQRPHWQQAECVGAPPPAPVPLVPGTLVVVLGVFSGRHDLCDCRSNCIAICFC